MSLIMKVFRWVQAIEIGSRKRMVNRASIDMKPYQKQEKKESSADDV